MSAQETVFVVNVDGYVDRLMSMEVLPDLNLNAVGDDLRVLFRQILHKSGVLNDLIEAHELLALELEPSEDGGSGA